MVSTKVYYKKKKDETSTEKNQKYSMKFFVFLNYLEMETSLFNSKRVQENGQFIDNLND